MKNIVLLIMMVFTIQFSSAQDISVNDFPNKILGKWKHMQYDNTLEDYVGSDYYYVFKVNNILEEYKGSVLIGTLNYEISFLENYCNGRTIKLANIKIIDPDEASSDGYQLDIFIAEDSSMSLTLEANKTAVISVYKKI